MKNVLQFPIKQKPNNDPRDALEDISKKWLQTVEAAIALKQFDLLETLHEAHIGFVRDYIEQCKALKEA